MLAKALEIRDEGTFIAMLCVDMRPFPKPGGGDSAIAAQRYLLRRCGYPCDDRPNIIMTRLSGEGFATNDFLHWKDRTFAVAHAYIIDHWAMLKDGDVVDVQFILGETSAAKQSERETVKEYRR